MRFNVFMIACSLTLGIATPCRADPPDFLAIDHIALHVRSLDASANWYQSHFGLRVLHKWNGVWMVGRGNIKIGLFLTSPLNPVADAEHAVIIEHFALSVDGDKFQGVIDQLRTEGVTLTAVEDTGIAYSVFTYDPDGHSVEITTYHWDKPPK